MKPGTLLGDFLLLLHARNEADNLVANVKADHDNYDIAYRTLCASFIT